MGKIYKEKKHQLQSYPYHLLPPTLVIKLHVPLPLFSKETHEKNLLSPTSSLQPRISTSIIIRRPRRHRPNINQCLPWHTTTTDIMRKVHPATPQRPFPVRVIFFPRLLRLFIKSIQFPNRLLDKLRRTCAMGPRCPRMVTHGWPRGARDWVHVNWGGEGWSGGSKGADDDVVSTVGFSV